MKRKSIKLVTTTLLLSTMLSFSSLAGWEQSEAGWKYKDDNTQQYVTARWVESTNEAGLWYYIKADGIMATNSLIDGVYYVNELGEWRESTGGSTSVNPGDQSNNQEKVPGTDIGWNADGSFNWGDLGASENLTSGGPITEEEKASAQNFLDYWNEYY